jgi:CRP/FNR family transcriptional regulator/CRP/FNR family cyclic AMP-dependent transcriptional regulator
VNLDRLKRVPLFESLGDEELRWLGQAARLRRFPRNCMVILADDRGDAFFIIESGQAKVSVTAPDGREIILSVLNPGDFFGDISLLDGRPRSANVTTLSESEMLVLRRPDFLKAVESHPGIAVKLMVTLAGRLRHADRQTAGLALLGIADRVCGVLTSLAEEEGDETDEGYVIARRPTHQVLASMAGTARETVTRVLGRLEEEGYIRTQGRKLVILKRRPERA